MKKVILAALAAVVTLTACGQAGEAGRSDSLSSAAVTSEGEADSAGGAESVPEVPAESAEIQTSDSVQPPETTDDSETVPESIEDTTPGYEEQAEEEDTSADYYAPPPPVYDMDGLTYITDPITGVQVLLASKTYSLPADFAPGLEDVTYEYFTRLTEAAAEEGLDIWIGSGYRSYYDQVMVYGSYVDEVGYEVADTFSARPGFSEHQTGLVIDCNTIDDSFGFTPEAEWLAEHAHEYGFIIRYPYGMDEVTGYKYEPWHIRYVGSEVATEIYKRQICLETYLGLENSEYAEPYWEY